MVFCLSVTYVILTPFHILVKSPAETLVETITGNPHLSVYHFIPGTDWCDEVISSLQKLAISEKDKTEFYVYEVLVQLSTLWLHFQKNMFLPPEKPLDPTSARMQAFQSCRFTKICR